MQQWAVGAAMNVVIFCGADEQCKTSCDWIHTSTAMFVYIHKQGRKVPNNITKIADSRRNLDAAYDGLLAFQFLTFNPEEPLYLTPSLALLHL